MHALLEFLKSDPVIGFLVASLIFVMTIILVARKSIGLSVTLTLLLFAVLSGLIISHHDDFQYGGNSLSGETASANSPAFKTQILQAVEDIKKEISIEKENIRKLTTQVQDVLDQLDIQKQKLQHFIEETREKFTSEPSKASDSLPIQQTEESDL